MRVGGALDDETRQSLRESRGLNAKLLDEVHVDAEMRKLKALESREAMHKKMASITHIEIDAYFCKECDMLREVNPKYCQENKHNVEKKRAKKRFFECIDCENRTTSVYSTPRHRCERCQGGRWKVAGMVKESVGRSEGKMLVDDERIIRGTL